MALDADARDVRQEDSAPLPSRQRATSKLTVSQPLVGPILSVMLTWLIFVYALPTSRFRVMRVRLLVNEATRVGVQASTGMPVCCSMRTALSRPGIRRPRRI